MLQSISMGTSVDPPKALLQHNVQFYEIVNVTNISATHHLSFVQMSLVCVYLEFGGPFFNSPTFSRCSLFETINYLLKKNPTWRAYEDLITYSLLPKIYDFLLQSSFLLKVSPLRQLKNVSNKECGMYRCNSPPTLRANATCVGLYRSFGVLFPLQIFCNLNSHLVGR